MVNGTILIVRELQRNIIRAEILGGPYGGKHTFIPRMEMCANQQTEKYIPLCRSQFPVRPAFAMTINKSQGQTLSVMGLYLPQPVFTHGQYYVALSRCGKRSNVKVMVVRQVDEEQSQTSCFTRNVVYREVLRWFTWQISLRVWDEWDSLSIYGWTMLECKCQIAKPVNKFWPGHSTYESVHSSLLSLQTYGKP